MTKRKKTPQEQLREEINIVANTIIAQAEQMIAQDVNVILAFRLAISSELEQVHYRNTILLLQQHITNHN